MRGGSVDGSGKRVGGGHIEEEATAAVTDRVPPPARNAITGFRAAIPSIRAVPKSSIPGTRWWSR